MADTPSRGGIAGTYLQSVNYGSLVYGAASGQGAAWFGPLAPIQPQAPADVAGRTWDFPVGYNLNTRTRAYEPISFAALRELADGYDLLRLAIETRKDQLARMSWSFKSRDSEAKDDNDPRVAALTSFFRRPDGEHGWQDWLRALLEDLFVIDAPALYAQRDRGGNLIALIQVDGATIKPVIDDWGRTPRPYSNGSALVYPPAYQQIIKGLPAVDYSTRDLLYRPRNKRVHHAYGLSQVEQIVTTVNIALRRQLSTLTYFTEGNIPDMIVQVPKEWSPDQIVAYQRHWDAYFDGDLGRRRRAKFVPGGVGTGGIHETRQVDLKGDFDEWLAKLVCFAFSISPQALTKQMNRASGETQKELAEEEGLEPLLLWLKAWIDDIIEFEFGMPDIEFAWDNDDEVDQAQQLTVLVGYTNTGIMTRNEARDRLGLDPLLDAEAGKAMVTTSSGVVPLDSFVQGQQQAQENAALLAEARAKQETQPVSGEAGSRAPPPRPTEQEDRQGVAKFSPDQPRGADGRWTSDGPSPTTDTQAPLTTREKVILGAGVIGAIALGALAHKKVPYRNFGSKVLEQRFTFKGALDDLHARSVHTPISEAEKASLAKYTGNDYATINKKLRLGHKPTEDINNIDLALNKSALAENAVVYRGVNLDRSKRLLKSNPGDVVFDKGYPSTSVSENIARGFAAQKAGAGTGQVPNPAKRGYVMSINLDQGTNALPLTDGYTKHPNLYEVLLPRSSSFKMLRVDHESKTIYMQHLGTSVGKVAETSAMTREDDGDLGDRFCWSDDDLNFYDAPDGDTTAEDYADYEPPQPDEVGKAFDPGEDRDARGEWTSGGAGSVESQDAADWHAAKESAFAIAKGVALTAAGALAVAFTPEIVGAAVAVGIAEGTATTAAGLAAGFADYKAWEAFYEAANRSGKVVLRSLGVDTDKIEGRLKAAIGVDKVSGATVDSQLRQALVAVTDHTCQEIVADLRSKHAGAEHLDTICDAVQAAASRFNASLAVAKVAKRKWGAGWGRPEPIPFDRPATRRAHAQTSGKLLTAFESLAKQAQKLVRAKIGKLAKAEPDDPDEAPEDRARREADEIVDAFDLSELQDLAGDIGEDLGDVVNDVVGRAMAQVGVDDASDLVDQVNERAVSIARDRAAELVGMKYDDAGNLVASDDAEMAITDTTRDMLRQTIADGLANNDGLDAIADSIADSYGFSSDRADTIAETEVARANGMAATESYREARDSAGVNVLKEWLAEAGCCDVCSDNAAAGPINLDDDFPSGDDAPPGHPSCRCAVSPVVVDDGGDDGAAEKVTKAGSCP